jgi:hypothetical protein
MDDEYKAVRFAADRPRYPSVRMQPGAEVTVTIGEELRTARGVLVRYEGRGARRVAVVRLRGCAAEYRAWPHWVHALPEE